jgi:type I restriction enzyme R subunit
VASTTFSFLAKGHDPLFLQLADAAERTPAVDPNTTLLKLRQLDEAFAKHAAAAAGKRGASTSAPTRAHSSKRAP